MFFIIFIISWKYIGRVFFFLFNLYNMWYVVLFFIMVEFFCYKIFIMVIVLLYVYYFFFGLCLFFYSRKINFFYDFNYWKLSIIKLFLWFNWNLFKKKKKVNYNICNCYCVYGNFFLLLNELDWYIMI